MTGNFQKKSGLFEAHFIKSRVIYYVPSMFPTPDRKTQVEDYARQAEAVKKLVTSLSAMNGGTTILPAAGAYFSNETDEVVEENTFMVMSYSFDDISTFDRLTFIELAVDFGLTGDQEEVLVEVGERVYRIMHNRYEDWRGSVNET